MVLFSLILVINTHPELGEIFRDMEMAIIKLMQKLEVIPEDVGKYMQENAANRGQIPQGQQGQIPPQMQGQMPGVMPQGMMPPGMMPGSNNPMDLLQMQQMQQMQQMFGNMQPPSQEKKESK